MRRAADDNSRWPQPIAKGRLSFIEADLWNCVLCPFTYDTLAATLQLTPWSAALGIKEYEIMILSLKPSERTGMRPIKNFPLVAFKQVDFGQVMPIPYSQPGQFKEYNTFC